MTFEISFPDPAQQDIYDKMTCGCFVVYWKEENGGGLALAAVGISRNGRRWFAPTNWITVSWLDSHIAEIEHVELLAS